MVACSKTVARGWSKVVGESRDVDKDVEATAHGSSEVRSEGDKDGMHTSKAGTQQALGESFADGAALSSCVSGSPWASLSSSSPMSLSWCLWSHLIYPPVWEASHPPTRAAGGSWN